MARLPLGPFVFSVSAADFHGVAAEDGLTLKAWCGVLARGGALFFQELASLLPPAVADLRPHHRVRWRGD